MHRSRPRGSHPASALIEALLDPCTFEHEAGEPALIETHISWLILAGDYVYKIKKPLVLDFLDFGDLDKRRFFCEEEIRLNKPWAPDIYLDVVPVTEDDGQYRFGGAGEAVEYAVRMRRFDQDLRLDRQLDEGLLTVQDMKQLAGNIASRHIAAARVDPGERERVLRLTEVFMEDNFTALRGAIDNKMLASLQRWTGDELDSKREILGNRFDDGKVRDCHGDLHLGNLVRLPDGITTFDCIEFNADLRHIDTMCDVAFLVMDLLQRGHAGLASLFLNRYLEATGDYGGIAVLNLFFVYRCLVRAKVGVIRAGERADGKDAERDLEEARAYCDMAERQAADRLPLLMIMHGSSGSGKTWVSEQLMAAFPAIRVRSDVERKRLSGLAETAESHSGIGAGIYSDAASSQVYSRLIDLSRDILGNGHSAILDAAFLGADDRHAAVRVASALGVPVIIVDVHADDATVQERLVARAAGNSDASEAGQAVLQHQRAVSQPLTGDERKYAIDCDNSVSIDVEEIVTRIRALAKEQDGFPHR